MLAGVILQGDDRDIQIGDWITYSLSGTGAYQFRPDNITNRIYVTQDIRAPPGDDSIEFNLMVCC